MLRPDASGSSAIKYVHHHHFGALRVSSIPKELPQNFRCIYEASSYAGENTKQIKEIILKAKCKSELCNELV